MVANILWKQVHDEIGFGNESAAKLKDNVDRSAFLSSASRARVVWMYIFALVIALRISKPIYALRIVPRRS